MSKKQTQLEIMNGFHKKRLMIIMPKRMVYGYTYLKQIHQYKNMRVGDNQTTRSIYILFIFTQLTV